MSFITGVLYSSIGIGGLITTYAATSFCNHTGSIGLDDELFYGWEETSYDFEVAGRVPIFLRLHCIFQFVLILIGIIFVQFKEKEKFVWERIDSAMSSSEELKQNLI